MLFTETKLQGAFIIDVDRREDDRGFFGRLFCQDEFAALGLKPLIAQANVGSNIRRGTIRGMHFQYPPVGETKYIRCTRGAILDIIVDLRPSSATYLEILRSNSPPTTNAGSIFRSASATGIKPSRTRQTRFTWLENFIRPAWRAVSYMTIQYSVSNGRCRLKSSPGKTRAGNRCRRSNQSCGSG